MSDWADIEAERSGLTEKGEPIGAPLWQPSEVHKERLRNNERNKRWKKAKRARAARK